MPKNLRASLWRQLAEEACKAAKRVHDPDLKVQVLLVAARYLALARLADTSDVSQDEDTSK